MNCLSFFKFSGFAKDYDRKNPGQVYCSDSTGGIFLRIVYDDRSVEPIGNMFNVSDIVGICYEHSDKIHLVLAHLNPKVVCNELGVDEYLTIS